MNYHFSGIFIGIAAIIIGFIIILTGGLKVLILLIQKLFGAQKFTAPIAEYKKTERQ